VDFQVRIAESALADFEEILEYSWINFPENAERFANALLDHTLILQRFPRLGSPVIARPGIRMLIHSPIRIYYALYEDRKLVEASIFGMAPGTNRGAGL
jgi:plasmid stabilization system protein ParE